VARTLSGLNQGNACYHAVQNLLSSPLLPKNVKIKIYKTVILPAVFIWVWNLVSDDKHRLKVFEDRVLRRIFGSKRDEMVGGWRKLQNGEFRNLSSSPNIIRMIKWERIRWAGQVARIGANRNAYRLLIGKLEEKRQLERPSHRWEDSIKMYFREIGWGDMD
jgi:hypothetical protein